MEHYEIVIVGGGIAAGYAAQAYVEGGGKPGELCIISADPRLPYERPPLSKGFLTDDQDAPETLINPPEFYEENEIRTMLGKRVDQVDFAARKVHIGDDAVSFDRLMIATGSSVRTLDAPGEAFDGIFYLRTLADAKDIEQALESAQRAVVLGGSFIGMEVAASLHQNNIQVSLVYLDERLGGGFFTDEIAQYFEDYYRAQGVRLISGQTAKQFVGADRVEKVVLDNGDEIAADLVVIGIGVEPNIELFEDSRLKLDEGIVVDSDLMTNIDEVYAVGDVAEYYDPIFGKRRRMEHWDAAMSQGEHVIKSILGADEPYRHLPYFFSDVFDLSYEFWGDTSNYDRVIYRGSMKEDSFSAWWLKDNRLVAAFLLDRPEEEREAAQQWTGSDEEIPLAQLENEEASLAV